MKKPDNIVFNYQSNEYDAYKKPYATNFNSKKFKAVELKSFKSDVKHYFESRFIEIKGQYENLLKEFEWSQLIEKAKYNFNPIVGKKYYLYKGEKQNFLSLIKPIEWKKKCLGEFKLTTNNTWTKIK